MISSRPSLLFRRQQTVQAALKAQQSQTKFRLEAITDTLMEPLEAMLDGKQYLVDDENLTSFDCLCFGYLSLLLYADVENTWISESMKTRYGAVCEYVARLRRQLLRDSTCNVQEILLAPKLSAEGDGAIGNLPWRSTETAKLASGLSSATKSMLARLMRPTEWHFLFPYGSIACANEPTPSNCRRWLSPVSILLTLSVPLLASATWLLYSATHNNMERNKYFGRSRPKLATFGAAGEVLSGLGAMSGMQASTASGSRGPA